MKVSEIVYRRNYYRVPGTDLVVGNCPRCGGLGPNRSDCVDCPGFKYMVMRYLDSDWYITPAWVKHCCEIFDHDREDIDISASPPFRRLATPVMVSSASSSWPPFYALVVLVRTARVDMAFTRGVPPIPTWNDYRVRYVWKPSGTRVPMVDLVGGSERNMRDDFVGESVSGTGRAVVMIDLTEDGVTSTELIPTGGSEVIDLCHEFDTDEEDEFHDAVSGISNAC